MLFPKRHTVKFPPIILSGFVYVEYLSLFSKYLNWFGNWQWRVRVGTWCVNWVSVKLDEISRILKQVRPGQQWSRQNQDSWAREWGDWPIANIWDNALLLIMIWIKENKRISSISTFYPWLHDWLKTFHMHPRGVFKNKNAVNPCTVVSYLTLCIYQVTEIKVASVSLMACSMGLSRTLKFCSFGVLKNYFLPDFDLHSFRLLRSLLLKTPAQGTWVAQAVLLISV